jgi:hypothetical protein
LFLRLWGLGTNLMSVDYLTGQQGVENNCGPVLSLLTPFNIFP